MVAFLIACNTNIESTENKTELASIELSGDFLSMPYGQPNSSSSVKYRWGLIEGEEKQTAMNESSKHFIMSLGLVNRILENVPIDKLQNDEIAESLAKIQMKILELREIEDTFIAEQIVAEKIQKKVFSEITSSKLLKEYENATLDNVDLKLIEFSTRLYIENANPNADMLALNLVHLKEFVNKEVFNSYVNQTIENANTWYYSESTCFDCMQKANIALSSEAKIEAIQKGIEKLLSL